MDEKEILKKTEMDLKGLVLNDENKQIIEYNAEIYLRVYNYVLAQTDNQEMARIAASDCLRVSLTLD
ncbi:hypothetical protein [Loigolactobacillus bifermentans]|uniref:hypothetical protein n=1 Tax=Loigolactobacillus bifermentans TaxID=1607 RepID=UPI00070A4E71|nr:hypothetical protein [Loigolactobacillus bifermentans]QGG59567.1 hypothetical protein LB003_03205 [Loigolactobacillus bifermentans]